MFESIVLYTAVLTAAAGAVSIIRPLRSLGIRTRGAAAAIFAAGLVAAAVTLAWPAREKRTAERAARLDALMPVWQFDERHTTHVTAPPEKVFAAIRTVRAEDILFFRTLTAIRRGWSSEAEESILNPTSGTPILDVAMRSGFALLADDSPREIVIGTHVAANAMAAMNFQVTSDGRGGSNVSTETRVYARSERSRKLFAVYWRAIRPGSDIIRRMWLRAIRLRAEA